MKIIENGSDLFELYEKLGFNFSRDILSRYTLALNANPFLILFGISGTGKTKIAQLFPIDRVATEDAYETREGSPEQRKNQFSIRVTNGFRDGDGCGNLPNLI